MEICDENINIFPLPFHCDKRKQRCVKRIVIEENRWKHKGGMPLQVSIYFNPRVFRYCPTTYEIAAVIARLKLLYGEKFMEELDRMVNEEYDNLVEEIKKKGGEKE